MWWSARFTSLLLTTTTIIFPIISSAQQSNPSCISLENSKTCQNFSRASISTSLTTDFPFLEFVSSVQDFDTQFLSFIQTQYTKSPSSPSPLPTNWTSD